MRLVVLWKMVTSRVNRSMHKKMINRRNTVRKNIMMKKQKKNRSLMLSNHLNPISLLYRFLLPFNNRPNKNWLYIDKKRGLQNPKWVWMMLFHRLYLLSPNLNTLIKIELLKIYRVKSILNQRCIWSRWNWANWI